MLQLLFFVQYLLKLNLILIAIISPTYRIQIQLLLKLNGTKSSTNCFKFYIQIQHLLKLNKKLRRLGAGYRIIQIQHLLKLNWSKSVIKFCTYCNSNTTLVKVKFVSLGKLHLVSLIQIQHLLKLNDCRHGNCNACGIFKYNTC